MLVKFPFGDTAVERHIETKAEGRELYPIHKLVESRALLMALSLLGCSNAEHAWDIASVVNAFCMFVLVLFFHHPIFAWIALSGFQSTGE